jgi:disulfide bond formation protein DsbB
VKDALLLALVAGAIAASTDERWWVDIVSGAGLALATVIGTAICGWTWWRMSDTLFAFLRTFMLVTKDPPANRARCELA